MFRAKTSRLFAVLGACLALTAVPALDVKAVGVASDTAIPNWTSNSSATYSNHFECETGNCYFAINTSLYTQGYSREAIAAGTLQPRLTTYNNTPCQASVTGVFTTYPGVAQKDCVTFSDNLTVNLNSGVSSVFSGQFSHVIGNFTPTQLGQGDQGFPTVKAGQITLDDSSTLDAPDTGSGNIAGAVFNVVFPGSGIELCALNYANDSSEGVTTSSIPGAITISKAV